MYFNYHAIVKKLISENKLVGWYIIDQYKKISPALVLVFDDCKHHIMPIREKYWNYYKKIIDEDLRINNKNSK